MRKSELVSSSVYGTRSQFRVPYKELGTWSEFRLKKCVCTKEFEIIGTTVQHFDVMSTDPRRLRRVATRYLNVCEKDHAGDTAYTEDIDHQCKNLKERREEEYIVLNKLYVNQAKHTREHHTKNSWVFLGTRVPPARGQICTI